MERNIKTFWSSLDRRIIVNQRELVLGVAACTLAGIVAGMLLSPKKNVTIGSHNGNNNTGNSAALSADDQTDEQEEEGE